MAELATRTTCACTGCARSDELALRTVNTRFPGSWVGTEGTFLAIHAALLSLETLESPCRTCDAICGLLRFRERVETTHFAGSAAGRGQERGALAILVLADGTDLALSGVPDVCELSCRADFTSSRPVSAGGLVRSRCASDTHADVTGIAMRHEIAALARRTLLTTHVRVQRDGVLVLATGALRAFAIALRHPVPSFVSAVATA